MSNNVSKLAKKLKEMKNKTKIGICVGVVTDIDAGCCEITIKPNGMDIRLGSGIGYWCGSETDWEIGDKVIVACGEDNNSFFVLGKCLWLEK